MDSVIQGDMGVNVSGVDGAEADSTAIGGAVDVNSPASILEAEALLAEIQGMMTPDLDDASANWYRRIQSAFNGLCSDLRSALSSKVSGRKNVSWEVVRAAFFKAVRENGLVNPPRLAADLDCSWGQPRMVELTQVNLMSGNSWANDPTAADGAYDYVVSSETLEGLDLRFPSQKVGRAPVLWGFPVTVRNANGETQFHRHVKKFDVTDDNGNVTTMEESYFTPVVNQKATVAAFQSAFRMLWTEEDHAAYAEKLARDAAAPAKAERKPRKSVDLTAAALARINQGPVQGRGVPAKKSA